MSLWCRKLSCPNNEGELYKDGKGAQGCCKLEENNIDKQGRCEDDSSE